MLAAPMHSYHPILIHLPLIAFAVAIFFDLVDAWRHTPRFVHASHFLWGFALFGGALAIASGLWAYNRVDHSEAAHAIMTLHRNLALTAFGALLVAAIWRWRRPRSRAASVYAAAAFGGLLWVAYLGGKLVYDNAVGIPSARLTTILHERESEAGEEHEHGGMKPAREKGDSAHPRQP
ncbi:MAG TPA: DUF2231 domain-containing protein [Gemmatimonadales bacterium]|nr:DUF2231 domain-containing protein [Gemmatimonadales bacterium]